MVTLSFYLWDKKVRTTFPGCSCHEEAQSGGGMWKGLEKRSHCCSSRVGRALGLKGVQGSGGASALTASPVVPPLWSCRQMDHQQGLLSSAISYFSQRQQTFPLTTLIKSFIFSFKNLIQYLIKMSRDVSPLHQDESSFTERRQNRKNFIENYGLILWARFYQKVAQPLSHWSEIYNLLIKAIDKSKGCL